MFIPDVVFAKLAMVRLVDLTPARLPDYYRASITNDKFCSSVLNKYHNKTIGNSIINSNLVIEQDF
ncbi:hypothetical protein [Methylobacter psychrophilus]|uniref:hypothetical protein n=1 Tax=Methylobacter psychrophilus TaxID=96941 RepID=UPI0021D4A8C7|nr:hypothetical protein [Methylobacter psychrophilus]